MYRVTRKQLIMQGGNVIEFEDFRDFERLDGAVSLHNAIFGYEALLGGLPYGPSKVIFETPSFYRSVQIAIEEITIEEITIEEIQ